MPSLIGSLKHAFASGATVVTPNRRLARRLTTLYDAEQRAAGRNVWLAAKVLPWDAWLETLWGETLAADVVPAAVRLRTTLQATHAWNGIVATHSKELIDPRGAAVFAADAWQLVHAWGAGGESWRAWAGDDEADDCATFARWASRYARELADVDAFDRAKLPDRLCAWTRGIRALHGAKFVFAGFTEFAPQQERLMAALSAAGVTITREDTLPGIRGCIARATGATPHDEIARALTWARARAFANPDATIAIAIEDLAVRLHEIRSLADEILCPLLQWPGGETAPRPYNISLGASLSAVPLVAAALSLLEWADHPLPLGQAAATIRSPSVGVATAWLRRASLEADWLRQGRRTISLRDAIASLHDVDPALAKRWAAAVARGPLPGRGTPREHAEGWRIRLSAMGWPGDRVLDSAEHQARASWDEALASFATLGSIESRMSRGDAQATLRTHLGTIVFQPETPPAPIQILGLLEAAGQPFDALWVAGLAAERWPPSPRPNPLLPVHWQRERNIPHSSAARELAYATQLTAQFARAAPEVIFSHAQNEDDHSCMPSLLLPRGADVGSVDLDVPVSTAKAQFSLDAPLERIPDELAPPMAGGVNFRGGAGLIEAQSDCPFKAVAAYRLGADTWPEPIDGLSPLERGTLVHVTLAAFWRAMRSQEALLALSRDAQTADVKKAVANAVDKNSGPLPRIRWNSVPPIVAAGEGARIEVLIDEWLDRFERPRPSFVAFDVEAALSLTLSGLSLRLRLDRIDTLGDGGVAIIDYKTGKVGTLNTWFDARPQSPQLGLYALAHRAAHPDRRLRAVAYAQIRPGELEVRGLAADSMAWPCLALPPALKNAGLVDWRAVEKRWSEDLEALATEIVAGTAAVSPRDRKKTCARCGRQSLCRIQALATEHPERDDDE